MEKIVVYSLRKQYGRQVRLHEFYILKRAFLHIIWRCGAKMGAYGCRLFVAILKGVLILLGTKIENYSLGRIG